MILLILSAAWLSGLGLAAWGFPEASFGALALGLGASAGFAIGRRPALALLAAACAGLFILGALRFDAALPSAKPSGLALLNDGGRLSMRGTVTEEPEERETSQRFVLEAAEVQVDGVWREVRGRVLITARAFPRYEYGDDLELTGRLETPPTFEGFDYREYLARRGIASVAAFPEVRRTGSGGGSAAKRELIAIRRGLGESLSQALPEPEAALARGILLGQRSSIPADVNDDFNRAGISHLIAISGSNVSILAGLALALLSWPLGRRRAVIAAMLLVLAFVLLVGATPSVLRAAVMGVLMLGALLAGRPGSALTAVAGAAAFLTAWQPLAALDVAFQLSFASTLGIILLATPLSRLLSGLAGRWLPEAPALSLSESVAVTTAASLAVFPITAANFERVSLVAVPANLLAVPLFGLVLLTSAATSAAGLASTSLGDLAGRFAEVPLSALLAVAGAFASLPGASLELRGFGTGAAVFLYAAIAVAAFILSRSRRTGLVGGGGVRIPPALAGAALVLAVAGTVWVQALTPSGGLLRVTVLDVGQGDAILVETPSGQRILVDGGPSGAAVLNALGAELPSGASRIDLVVLTHPQEDHVAGLVAVSERYDVRQAATGASVSQLASYRAWREALGAERTPLRMLGAGEVTTVGDVRIEVLGPQPRLITGTEDDLNTNSVVLRITYGSVSFLLTGDLGREGEEALLSARGGLHATVLKVGHHGSDGSSTSEFLAAVRPSVAVISAGDDNTYGHPSPTTLLRLSGVPVYRTDRNGTVRFETDGKRLFVRPDRGGYQLVPVSASR